MTGFRSVSFAQCYRLCIVQRLLREATAAREKTMRLANNQIVVCSCPGQKEEINNGIRGNHILLYQRTSHLHLHPNRRPPNLSSGFKNISLQNISENCGNTCLKIGT